MSRLRMKAAGHEEWLEFDFALGREGMFTWEDGALAMSGRIVSSETGEGWLDVEGRILPFVSYRVKNRVHVWARGQNWWIELAAPGKAAHPALQAGDEIVAPMPGTVLKVNLAAGAEVAAQQTVLVLESMKMELSLPAPRAGRIAEIRCKEGDLVEMGATLARLEKVE